MQPHSQICHQSGQTGETGAGQVRQRHRRRPEGHRVVRVLHSGTIGGNADNERERHLHGELSCHVT